MIPVPIRCFTCSKVIADKYRYYLDQVRTKKGRTNADMQMDYLTEDNLGVKSVEGQVLDDMHIKSICCRRHFLTQPI